MQMRAEEFNLQAERYYRETLRRRHLAEAFTFLRQDLRELEFNSELGKAWHESGGSLAALSDSLQFRVAQDEATEDELRRLIKCLLLSLHNDLRTAEGLLANTPEAALPVEDHHAQLAFASAPVH
jgi:hypothetical protein